MSRVSTLEKEAENKTSESFEDQKVSDIAAALKKATSTIWTASEDNNLNLARRILGITTRKYS